MFSKLDNILCLERKRENRKSSFLIRDILNEDDEDDEEVIVADEEDFHPGPSLLALPQGGALWDTAGAVYSQPLVQHHEDLLAARGLQRGGLCTSSSLSLCCLNCPPQSWHTGFGDMISPSSLPIHSNTPIALVPSAAATVSWSASAEAAAAAGNPIKECTGGGGKGGRKVRRNRTVFTELQLMGLERRFDCQKYLSTPDRAELARALNLTQLQVKTWYQNRRMKWKKQVMQGGCTVPPTKPKGRPKKNSIPSLNETRTANELAALKDAF
ncbi:hypothetical protein JTE90_017330 [Oedothorax gibbosus]|uniref:Homeobox domain-containing protein n=1 Tax=Oedothorax gibbosus TaxID=931172 RepID=A0AAV6UDK3_9ARAC|nr:hypothetical protein JTE90_017330 [Oedothorax gibbosus]